MKNPCLILFACTAACATTNDAPPVPTFSDGKADGTTTPACSTGWWSWLNTTYLPMLDKPATEVSADDLAKEKAAAPAMGETPYTYALCYRGAFDKYVFAPAAQQLTSARKTYVDRSSPDYQSYSAYLAHAAPSAELVRNAEAIAAIKPSAMDRESYGAWMVAYSTVLAMVVEPVGMPGPSAFIDVQEPEWTFDAADDAYAAMLEAGLAPSNQDGAFDVWLEDYKNWLFHGGNNGNSYVFNIEQTYGCSGVDLGSNGWEMPPLVRAFLDRFQATRPRAIGPADHSKWMSVYNGYVVRLVGDIGNSDAYGLDDLMLQTIEEVMPPQVMGLFPYQTWLGLAALDQVQNDQTLAARVALAKPCVAQTDLAAATASYQMTAGGIAAAAPQTCP
jgi:hypothetical protein